jgi:predicted deacetylase
MARKGSAGAIAVAIHDVEPATWERCSLIRDWLADHGIERVTLLVIPARDLHPLGGRSPGMSSWLIERSAGGDSIAQHGFQHERLGGGAKASKRLLRRVGRRDGEFAGLDERETRRMVDAGWRVLKLAGAEPDGFVAPSYLYTPQLRRVLPMRFRWWATLLHVEHALAEDAGDPHERGLAPAWSAGTPGPVGRLIAPVVIRAGARVSGDTLRVDVHPTTLQHPRQVRALESVLAREGRRRESLTLGELPARRRSTSGAIPGRPAAV